MAKQTTNTIKKGSLLARRKMLAVVASAIVVLLLALGGAFVTARYQDAQEDDDVAAMSELLVSAADGLKANAPLDPKTGDTYFPGGKLYLPIPAVPITFTYQYIPPSDEAPAELSVSSRQILNTNASRMRNSHDLEELFNQVPRLQACQRGIRLMPEAPANATDFMLSTVKLQNGKDLFVYYEKQCPDLSRVADLLVNIKAY